MSNQEIAVIDRLKTDFNLKIEEACFSKGYIPKFILLDRSRNIHSYIIPCHINDGELTSSYWNSLSFDESIIQFLRVQYSQLDRPLFFVYEQKNAVMIIESGEVRSYFDDKKNESLMKFMIEHSYHLSDAINLIRQEI